MTMNPLEALGPLGRNLVGEDKEVESFLSRMYQDGIETELGLRPFTIHPTRFRYGASDSTCSRLAFLRCHLHQMIKEFSTDVRRKFEVGNVFHRMADDGIDKMLWKYEGEMIRVSSFRLQCFPDLFKNQSPCCVTGTPDHILLVPRLKRLFLVDQKSANDYGFKDNKRNGASIYHGIQIGTYWNGLMNSALFNYVDGGALYVCYMSKESMEIAVRKVPPSTVRDARSYWEAVANAAATNGEQLPPALPREKWACKYCPIFKGEKNPQETCDKCTNLSQVRDYLSTPGGENDGQDDED